LSCSWLDHWPSFFSIPSRTFTFTHFLSFEICCEFVLFSPILYICTMSRYGDVLWAGLPWFDSRQGRETVLFPQCPDRLSQPHPAFSSVGTGALSPELKRWGEADHSHPSSTEIKNGENYTSTPPYVFLAWCLIV
jgi:hypothetical protein